MRGVSCDELMRCAVFTADAAARGNGGEDSGEGEEGKREGEGGSHLESRRWVAGFLYLPRGRGRIPLEPIL